MPTYTYLHEQDAYLQEQDACSQEQDAYMLAATRTEAEGGNAEWGGTARLWQECSTLLQLGNAKLVLSANGR